MIETPWGYFNESPPSRTDGGYKPGEIVYLTAGGPSLTVIKHDLMSGTVLVSWFAESTFHSVILPDAAVYQDEPEELVPYANATGDTLH